MEAQREREKVKGGESVSIKRERERGKVKGGISDRGIMHGGSTKRERERGKVKGGNK